MIDDDLLIERLAREVGLWADTGAVIQSGTPFQSGGPEPSRKHNNRVRRLVALVAEECASQARMLMRACLPQATAAEVARKDAYNHALENAVEAIRTKFKDSP